MDRARHGRPAGPRRAARGVPVPVGGGALRQVARAALGAASAACAIAACQSLSPDFDAVIAIEVVVRDSGRIEVGDTLRPTARALNGRGESTAAVFVWSALDTILQVVDSNAGTTVGRNAGTGRLQARVGNLRSNPITITILAPLDSIRPVGPGRDTITVSGPDSLSDSLTVLAFGPTGSTAGRRIAVSVTFPLPASNLTLVPRDTVPTNGSGVAVFQLRLTGGPLPDSAVVAATARRADGTLVPGSPVTFVVEFRP
ncbi:MAG: hypothetical protein ACREMW_03305 [Gemmatimonadales bacterium]